MIRKPLSYLSSLLFCVSTSLMAQDLPLKEHEMLKMDEGTWSAKISFWAKPDTTAIQGTAVETNFMLGELWSVGKMEGSIAGTDFEGFATLGYDPEQQKYVGTWVDSVDPVITQMTGSYDETTKTLVLFYRIFLPDGQPQERKNVMVYKDKDTRDFTMYIKDEDNWVKSMAMLYKRTNPIEE